MWCNLLFFKERRLRFIGDDITVGLSCGDQAVTDQDKQGQAPRLVIVSPALRRAGWQLRHLNHRNAPFTGSLLAGRDDAWRCRRRRGRVSLWLRIHSCGGPAPVSTPPPLNDWQHIGGHGLFLPTPDHVTDLPCSVV